MECERVALLEGPSRTKQKLTYCRQEKCRKQHKLPQKSYCLGQLHRVAEGAYFDDQLTELEGDELVEETFKCIFGPGELFWYQRSADGDAILACDDNFL